MSIVSSCKVEMAELLKKPGVKSLVWDYFGVKKSTNGGIVDDGTATCRECRRSVVAKHGNTSNLLSHLRNHHSKTYSEVTQLMKRGQQNRTVVEREVKQPSIEEATAYERTGKRWKELTESVTYFLAKDSQPMYIEEKSGFKNMLRMLDARYKPPRRKFFSQTAIPRLYTTVREQVVEELSTVTYFPATTDLRSSIGLKPYLSYTVHYIGSDWTLKSKCLQTHFMPEDHTSEHLSEALTTTLETWDLLPENQVCITTDSGSNIVKATRDLNWRRLSCFGHNLHLAVTKAVANDSMQGVLEPFHLVEKLLVLSTLAGNGKGTCPKHF